MAFLMRAAVAPQGRASPEVAVTAAVSTGAVRAGGPEPPPPPQPPDIPPKPVPGPSIPPDPELPPGVPPHPIQRYAADISTERSA